MEKLRNGAFMEENLEDAAQWAANLGEVSYTVGGEPGGGISSLRCDH